MTVYTALTTLPGKDAAEALGDSLEALDPAPTGIGVFEVEDGSGLWEVGGYFDGKPDLAGLSLLAAAFGAREFAVSALDDRDWVAQVRRELSPVWAGRFVVYGEHDAARIPPAAIGLKIEAAMAFGTGHHGTTQGCLMLLDRMARRGARPHRVADIGCGTGVLAMAAVKRFRIPAVAGDIDPIAARTARENARANGTSPLQRSVQAVGFRQEAFRARAPYDLVFANILAAPLKKLAPEIRRHLAPGGVAVLSGLLTRQVPGVLAVYRGHALVPVDRITLGEWTSLVLRRVETRPL